MESCWRLEMHFFLLLSLLLLNLNRLYSLNSEGIALLSFRERVEKDPYGSLSNWNGYDDKDPCLWFGVVCVDGEVVNLNLQDLCLKGTLAPELGKLSHMKYLILHNNSFSGIIPKEIGELKELPSELSSALSLQILLLSHNRFLNSMSAELHELSMHSKFLVDENMLSDAAREAIWNQRYIASISLSCWLLPTTVISIRNIKEVKDAGNRRLLEHEGGSAPSNGKSDKKRNHTHSSPSSSPSPSLPPSLAPLDTTTTDSPPPRLSSPVHSPAASPSPLGSTASGSQKHTLLWKMSLVLGASFLLTVSIIGVLFCRKHKVVTVRPWATGLSGQLQKAFVTGVPSLKRQEIEAACEDFSNIIGSSPDSKVYKGTLSNGVEIAVTSTAVASVKDWSKNLETHFRKKIDTLSKVNHKNFVNLLGYCKEEEPFTRMMVFEYAPNGTLFEHLHIKEAEHLDWATRLRIAMGMAYCLDHMHQLNPPIAHKNLQSKTVYLSDDYAAKISEFTFWNEVTTVKKRSNDTELSNMSPSELEHNVYSFGVVLLEMMSGKLPFSENEGQLIDWALDYLSKARPISDLMDPTLKAYQEEEASALLGVILPCINPNPKKRPSMREVTARLREITGMTLDAATPKLSPLWWAELEILSTSDAS
ncbi:inactive receptor-like serine/threonine-protein kinase At2g40270 isoform X2 [Magnolia sinica]|uniref:inactive receptor-like serine/threonine-protein kinase At2g40270 isoform X2 n=1 Tax=Magnolia sinica TaxID=86752 RepID=UPI00265AB23B|nr:inactive receptor-like serine/threonine-protein kinase At2g40270 isoform X2 [Magnolia sinica]